MSTISSYVFDNMDRIGDDNCSLSQRNVQNMKESNYMLENFFAADCRMEQPIVVATEQPNIFYNGSHQTGIGGCNIDENTVLRDGGGIMHPKCRISLLQRPFITVPYLGRGPGNAILEAQLQQGELNINRKTVNADSELSHINYRFTPLIPSIAATIANANNLISENAFGVQQCGMSSSLYYSDAAAKGEEPYQ